MRTLVLATLVVSAPALAAEPPAEYVPAPAKDIPGYSEKVFPCEAKEGWRTTEGNIITEDDKPVNFYGPSSDMATYMVCHGGPALESMSLRELAILRNTIYARYGWAGFRKSWLREHFQKQPWYRPDPKFTYKRLSKVDRQNTEIIAQAELSFRYVDLERMRNELLAKAGKWWGDLPSYEGKKGKEVIACDLDDYKGPTTETVEDEVHDETEEVDLPWVRSFKEAVAGSKDCTHHGGDRDAIKKHRSNSPIAPDLDQLDAEDRIELGLISRAMGDFALDEGQRAQAADSLDKVLAVKELRQLSLRDLRLLRNTIYARRGRPFKSPLLQEHFKRMPWYTPDPAYTDKRLTKTDKRNIDLIVQVENEFGGALMDKDFQVGNPSRGEDVEPPPSLGSWA
jgi:hypothetical protein